MSEGKQVLNIKKEGNLIKLSKYFYSLLRRNVIPIFDTFLVPEGTLFERKKLAKYETKHLC